MKTADEWSAVLQGVALLIPGVLALLALVSPRRAALAASAALGLALLFGAGLFASQGSCHGGGGDLGVRLDAVTSVMLLLVSFIGLIIVRYARTYLHGEAGLARFHRWLLLTLAAVTSLVVVNNLLVLALAWIATSVALHQLLTFYPDRTAAVVAAHKKFLVSRLADLCLLGFLALTQASVGSLELDQVTAWAGAHPGRTPSMQLAAGLLVVAVALKSAQLPFHGWLTQVMEAPTPVSALLHAGVVNIGGFVLIRLAPLLAGAGPARMLLVVVGLVSTVIASLIMTTRVSVKVALAWSTCAQLGFMLVQCGLGLWHLALLHLVAHSLYKAHAFLSTGTAVHGWRLQAMAKRRPLPSVARIGLGVLVAVGASGVCVAVLQRLGWVAFGDLSVPVLGLLVGLSLIPLLSRTSSGPAAAALDGLRASGVALLYVAWHAVAARLFPFPAAPASRLAWCLVGAGLVGLFAVKAALQLRPDGSLARALYPWLFAGLYLDERFTRLTFHVWPPRLDQGPGLLPIHTRIEVVEAQS
jgi:NAD(P)H-quinone oxidoreductase subunit 5